jgi:hypothetical protein
MLVLIPIEALWVIWTAATLVSAIAAITAWRAGTKPMAVALAGFALGAASMVSFYTMLIYVPFDGSYLLSIAWSRWAISVNGLMILGGSLSALIMSRGRHDI